jgi:hypothetical protein
VHALVDGAADLMGEAALAVRSGAHLADLAAAIHPHPTLTESFGITARAAIETPKKSPPGRRLEPGGNYVQEKYS